MSRISTKQVLTEYDQTRESGKELLLTFWHTQGEKQYQIETIRCRKPQTAEVDIEQPPAKEHDQRGGLGYSLKQRKAILVEKIDPENERDRFKTIKICSLIKLNGYVIFP